MTFFVIFGEICPKMVLIHFRRFEKCQKWSFLIKKSEKTRKNAKKAVFSLLKKCEGKYEVLIL